MAVIRWPNKDPDEVLDYLLDWKTNGRLIDGDVIASSTWVVPDGITKDSDSHDDETTTIWLSGGIVATQFYELTNRVVTDGGRTMDQTVKLRVKSK